LPSRCTARFTNRKDNSMAKKVSKRLWQKIVDRNRGLLDRRFRRDTYVQGLRMELLIYNPGKFGDKVVSIPNDLFDALKKVAERPNILNTADGDIAIKEFTDNPENWWRDEDAKADADMYSDLRMEM
jgi:hypothetical protein